jgi:sugar/nucleoside kinase (ribokinase family)
LWAEVEKAAKGLLEKGIRELCVIHFPEGGVAVRKDGSTCIKESRTVPSSQIVSAVGAGDAFCAGCLYAIHEDYPLDRMLEFANTSARFNLFNATSTGGAPSLKEIECYLCK